MIENLEIIERRRVELRAKYEQEYDGEKDLVIDALAHYAAVQEDIVRKLKRPSTNSQPTP